MSPLELMLSLVFWPAVCGALTLLLPREELRLRTLLSIVGVVGSISSLWLLHNNGLIVLGHTLPLVPEVHLNFSFNLDRLSTLFVLMIQCIGLGVLLYARAYFGPDKQSLYRFYPTLLLFMTAMLGLVLSDTFMGMLLFWELTSISSFLLIGWEREDREATRKAMQAFIVTGLGGLSLLAGLILLGSSTGIWRFSELSSVASLPTLTGWKATMCLLLIFGGAATKSAQWPFHFWLPGAMAAPTPVSAYLHSATMVKAGIYLLARISSTQLVASSPDVWLFLLIPIGTITMLWGAIVAISKSDLKQIFAYTTVSQLGLLVCALGLSAIQYESSPCLIWGSSQILNHALYKAPLFMLAGAIAHHIHTRRLHEMRGLVYRDGLSRWLVCLMLLGLCAMAALPGTFSFFAKEFFLYGLWNAFEASRNPGLLLVMVAAVITAAINVALLVRFAMVFFNRNVDPSTHEPMHDHPHTSDRDARWPVLLWLPAAVMIAAQFAIGFQMPWPWSVHLLLRKLEFAPNLFGEFPVLFALLFHPGPPLYMSAAGIVLGIVLGLSRFLRAPTSDPCDRIFPAFYKASTVGGGWIFKRFQTGNLRHYLYIMLSAIVLLVAWGWIQSGRPMPDAFTLEPFGSLLGGYLLCSICCIASLLMLVVRGRAARVLMLGTVGFTVTGIYYLYNAPDLALTQISIEIISLLLFLLVLGLVPVQRVKRPARLPRGVMAIAVGVVMFGLTLLAAGSQRPEIPWLNRDGRPFAGFSEFFLRNSNEGVDLPDQHGGGGNNVVNVILVDFRGFDTLGEITVLGIAALGVWTLLNRRLARREDA